MNKNEKMWAIYVGLGYSRDDEDRERSEFDEDVWNYIIDESAKCGLNTIILEIDNAIVFHSHPEIAAKGAWTQSKLKKELAKCKAKNLKVIPMLNFASPHDDWMLEHHRKLSTPEYYQVCNDIIKEVYEMFNHPEYINIAMDEEDAKHVKKHELAVYRQGELYWHDLRFLIDCVKATGAKPWMWADPLFDHPEEYAARFEPDEALLSPWYYNAFKEEHYIPIDSRENLIIYYNEEEYRNMDIKYVEDDPFLVNFRNVALPLMEKGYKYVPCASICNRCDHNHMELLEYFKENAPDEQIVGYMSAPWKPITKELKWRYEETFEKFKEAIDTIYK